MKITGYALDFKDISRNVQQSNQQFTSLHQQVNAVIVESRRTS